MLEAATADLSTLHPDIALKFEALPDAIGPVAYSPDKSESGRIKIQVYEHAAALARGYLLVDDGLPVDTFQYPSDDHAPVRRGLVDAVSEIHGRFGSRLPWAFYGGYLFLASRENLTLPERLPDVARLLPGNLPWQTVDAVWHGLPTATRLYMGLLTVFSRRTGRIPLHGCGCNHYLPPIREDDRFRVECPEIPASEIAAETEVPVSHFLVQLELLARGLPNDLGLSHKALEMHRQAGGRMTAVGAATEQLVAATA